MRNRSLSVSSIIIKIVVIIVTMWSSDKVFASCPAAPFTGPGIRTIVLEINSKVDILLEGGGDTSCCSELDPILSYVVDIDSKIDNISGGSCSQQSIIDQLGVTIVDQSQTVIDELGITIVDNTNPILSMVTDIDSKIDTLLVDEANCCTQLNSSIDQLGVTVVDQSQTVIDELGITIVDNADVVLSAVEPIGQLTDLSANIACYSTLDQIDTAELTVISWLKTIARQLAGLSGTCP